MRTPDKILSLTTHSFQAGFEERSLSIGSGDLLNRQSLSRLSHLRNHLRRKGNRVIAHQGFNLSLPPALPDLFKVGSDLTERIPRLKLQVVATRQDVKDLPTGIDVREGPKSWEGF